MNGHVAVEEIEDFIRASKVIGPSEAERSPWTKQLMGQFQSTQCEETQKVDPREFELIHRAKNLPPMNLVPGAKNWIERAKEMMANSDGEKARRELREREAIEHSIAMQKMLVEKAREDEEKAAAEERRRRQIEEEAQRTEWDIL